MEKQEYEIMFQREENHWWYGGLHDLVLGFMPINLSCKILDAGCGTGKMLDLCKEYQAYGLDISKEAIKFYKLRNIRNSIQASICDIPFRDETFDMITSLDVLYHKAVRSDTDALAELFRIIKTGGNLILNLPAFEFLRSTHDEAIHTRHRYNRKEIKSKLEKAGFAIKLITYRNIFLFPIELAIRFLKKASTNRNLIKSDLYELPEWLNRFLYGILKLENLLIRKGIIFPLGLSLFCIAKK